MTKAHVVILGSINVDLVTTVNALPLKGETVFADTFLTEYGGKGANQAVAAARLGAKVSMIGRVGSDDFGQQVLNNLQKESVNTDGVSQDKATSTGVALITVDAQSQNTIVVSSGANMTCGDSEIGYLKTCLPTTDCLVLQNEVPYEVNIQAARLAQENKVPVVWDPAPFISDSKQLVEYVNFLTPNQHEGELLANCPITDKESIHKALLNIKDFCNAVCFITMGEDGVFFLSGSGIEHIPSYSVESVDSVAAGDAFAGGFSVALSEGKTIRLATSFACASGALATTKLGAQSAMPLRQEVEQLMKPKD